MPRTPRPPKPDAVSVSAKIRKNHPWIAELTVDELAEAIKCAREKWTLEGKKLSAAEIIEAVDNLEELQKKLNPLEVDKEDAVEIVKIFWGHTGMGEIAGTTGNTLIAVSPEWELQNPEKIEGKISQGQWMAITKRTIDPKLAFAAAEKDENLRALLAKHMHVKKLKVSVTAPSSRRPKSGETFNGDEDD